MPKLGSEVGRAGLEPATNGFFAGVPHGTAHADTVGHNDAYAAEDDDNADGRIDEDESGFDCRVMGTCVAALALSCPTGRSRPPVTTATLLARCDLLPARRNALRRHCDGQERGTSRTAGLRCRRVRRRLQPTDRAGTALSFRAGGRSAALFRIGGHAYPLIGGHAFHHPYPPFGGLTLRDRRGRVVVCRKTAQTN